MFCCCSRKKGSKKPGFDDNNIQNMGDKVYLIQNNIYVIKIDSLVVNDYMVFNGK
jgi:hypothetical protein